MPLLSDHLHCGTLAGKNTSALRKASRGVERRRYGERNDAVRCKGDLRDGRRGDLILAGNAEMKRHILARLVVVVETDATFTYNDQDLRSSIVNRISTVSNRIAEV